jgi:putative tryptophan/tyrosine transport system substrate-binding protein
VAIIVATGGDPAAQATKEATKTIPIVFVSGSDPVKFGLVSSLSRPEGNITGIHLSLLGLGAKRLGLLHELVPTAKAVGVLVNPNNAGTQSYLTDVREAARSLGLELHVGQAVTEQQVDEAFAILAKQRPDELLVAPDPFFTVRRVRSSNLQRVAGYLRCMSCGNSSWPVA